ncbi:MAG: DNA methyltransferase [Clostridia bacterium]|nr:DNA methyltransferase [Clostridia bacterium]
MADNASLGAAKNAKNDEFYTQYSDIEAEMNAYVEFDPDVFRGKTILLPCDDPEWSNFTKYFASNFERFGLKKLISTSYAKGAGNKQLSMFEMMSPLYDENLHETRGKLFTLTRDVDGSGLIDTDDVEFSGYLEGDGDFRSAEVTKLRDEADIIITNPPFSLFREFLAWIMEGGKQFIILGNMNAITYKEVFPYLKDNQIWLGYKSLNLDMYFNVTDEYKAWLLENKKEGSAYRIIKGVVMGRLASACWFTNIDHGKRHESLLLDTMAHNLKYNKKLKKKFEEEYGVNEYPHYDNYDAIEVPFTECIPSDYVPCWFDCPKAAQCEWAAKKGVDGTAAAFCENACAGNMGVPITFLDKHSPEQFEIVGADYELARPEMLENGKKGTDRFYIKTGVDKPDDVSDNCSQLAAQLRLYARIVVRRKM